MAERTTRITVICWRDMPAQVIAGQGRGAVKIALPERFEQAIDRCAMKIGARDTDAYLAEWRKGEPSPVSDDLEAEADRALTAIEAEFTRERLVALVNAEGRAS